MSKMANVIVVAEGASEQNFVELVLSPYMGSKGIFLQATQISKKGQKGGDVKFERAKRDVAHFLRQRSDCVVSTFVDYYGVKEWPGLDQVRKLASPTPDVIADVLNKAAIQAISKDLPDIHVENRYLPFTAVHEFEALLFSDARILSQELGVDLQIVLRTLAECGSPERINTSRETSPSNRLLTWTGGHYAKVSQGVAISRKIGIDKIRSECPNFDAWLKRLEQMVEV